MRSGTYLNSGELNEFRVCVCRPRNGFVLSVNQAVTFLNLEMQQCPCVVMETSLPLEPSQLLIQSVFTVRTTAPATTPAAQSSVLLEV